MEEASRTPKGDEAILLGKNSTENSKTWAEKLPPVEVKDEAKENDDGNETKMEKNEEIPDKENWEEPKEKIVLKGKPTIWR